MEHHGNMADDGMTLKLDEALTRRLRTRALEAGQSVEDYARQALDVAAEPLGLSERGAAYWQEIEAICDEADRTGGVPWEQVEARLLNFGQKR
jgi:plasmid stability protein